MSTVRLIALPLLLAAATACVNTPASNAPRPLKPEDGPSASIRVGYTGGLINRSLSAYFRTDESAYVIVGHLGGDGVIRILYPATPDESGLIRGKQTLQTATVNAAYDGVPGLFSYAMSPHRTLSSLYDSYDGRGHGYVFIVASRRPLRYDLLMDAGGWSDWQVDDYSTSHDPRYSIRDFAETVAGGAGYTLRFATSFATSHYDAFASRAWDCALLSNVGFFGYSPWWSSWTYGALGYRYSLGSQCGGGYGFGGRYAYNTLHRGPVFIPTIVPVIPTEPTVPAPNLDRPGRRGIDRNAGERGSRSSASFTRIPSESRAGTGALSSRRSPTRERPAGGDLGRRAEGVSRTYDPPARPTHHERMTESGSTSRRGGGESSAGTGSRSAPAREATPRESRPRESAPRETGSRERSTSGGSSSPRSERPAVSNPREVRSSSGKPDQH